MAGVVRGPGRLAGVGGHVLDSEYVWSFCVRATAVGLHQGGKALMVG